MAEPVKLEIGLKLSIPVTVRSIADRSNIMVEAGARTVLLEAGYLESSSEVLALPPPPKQAALEAKVEQMGKVIEEMLAKLTPGKKPKPE